MVVPVLTHSSPFSARLVMTEEMSLDSWEANEDGIAVAPKKNADGKGGNFRATQPTAKKSRRAGQKRIVSVPVGDTEGLRAKNGSGGEVFPQTDAWAWRKYGQKPIKGSPYPRGYYRCSSCKGCPARKQVERSRHDPTKLVVTYSFEHNHPGPLPKSARRRHASPLPRPEAGREEEKCLTSAAEEEDPLGSMMTALKDGGEFRWFSNVASPSSTSAGSDELLYGSVFFGGGGGGGVEELVPVERDTAGMGEEDALFAGLGELPEYSVALRRGMAAEPWIGTTG